MLLTDLACHCPMHPVCCLGAYKVRQSGTSENVAKMSYLQVA